MYFRIFLDRIKRFVISLVFVILIVIGFVIYQLNFNYTTLQVIEDDIKLNQRGVIDEYFVGEGTLVKLDDYDGNEITIMKVTSKGVFISRRVEISEFTPAPEGMYGGKLSSHYENVEEFVSFDEEFSINKDVEASRPGVPAVEQARFSYSLKFVKK